MDIEYVPDLEMREAVKDAKAVLTGIDGKFRWVATREDGTQYLIRPESTKDAGQQ